MRIGIIGSGFGAMSVAIEFMRAGHRDVRLWERSHEVGGVWRDNTYPGAACDVPSPLYSFSFEKNTEWSRRYAPQPEIHAYLRKVARTYGITERTRFGAEVVAATWDEASSTWMVEFASGDTETVDLLVTAVGQLSSPRRLDVPGAGTFAGPEFHSAQWDHDVDLADKHVAVLGAGASAIQFVPHLARDAAKVTVFQRSASYILPKPDGPYPRWAKAAILAERPGVWWLAEQFSRSLDEGSFTGRTLEKACRAHLEHRISDPALRARLTPDYPIGCKRILFSNDYYKALALPHVDVTTDRITHLAPTGVGTTEGLVEADVVIHATGFATQEFLSTIDITGAGGTKLAAQWTDGARAHLGMYVPHFPNLFISYGPNTNLGGSSIIFMLEAQARHMRQVVDRMVATGAVRVEPTEAAEQAWDDDVQGRLEQTVWGDCDNWYRHASGRITSNWPGGTLPFARRVRHLDAKDFAWT